MCWQSIRTGLLVKYLNQLTIKEAKYSSEKVGTTKPIEPEKMVKTSIRIGR